MHRNVLKAPAGLHQSLRDTKTPQEHRWLEAERLNWEHWCYLGAAGAKTISIPPHPPQLFLKGAARFINLYTIYSQKVGGDSWGELELGLNCS